MAARCYILRKANGWMDGVAAETAKAAQAARRASQLGRDDPVALCRAGFALARVVGAVEEGAALIERALALDPNLAVAWHFSGLLKTYVGEPDDAIERLGRAMRLSPLDRELYWMQAGMGLAHFVAGRYAEGVTWAERAIRENPTYLPGYRTATVCLALSGRLDEARRTAARLQALDPSSRIANIAERVPLRRPEDFARYAEALRAAGLPE
jgi:tetratricopeptide (TPR) repeat protein